MATIAITATSDDIDGLTVHFETGRAEGALFWDFEDNLDGGHVQAPPDCAHRFVGPGTYNVTARAENGDSGTVAVTVPEIAGGGMAWVLEQSFPASIPAGTNNQIHAMGTGLPTSLPATGWSIRAAGVECANLGIATPGSDLIAFIGPLTGLVGPGVYDVAVIAPDGAQILPGSLTLT